MHYGQQKMDLRMRTGVFFLLSVLFRTHFCAAADTLFSGQSLILGRTLVSKDENFELGFFRPGNSQNYFVGIWYKRISGADRTYAWVANRNAPVIDVASAELKLSKDGNLVLYSNIQSKTEVWSTNTTSKVMNSSQAVLGDDGNFVLRNGVRRFDVYWQSFDHPTDTWLPGGRLKYDNITKKSQLLTSWRNRDDPSEGLFSLELDPVENSYVIKRNHSERYWSSGSWNGQIFQDIPEMRFNYIYSYSYNQSVNESFFTYDMYDTTTNSRYVIDSSGQMKVFIWEVQTQRLLLFWSQPQQQCEVYAYCGAFGVCNQNEFPSCKCMEGFRPRSQTAWDLGDFTSGGCVRERPLKCDVEVSFFRMSNVRLPDNPMSLPLTTADQCKATCFNSCSCSAYAYSSQCSIWSGPLLHVQQFMDGNGSHFYLRTAVSPVQGSGDESKGADKKKKNNMKVILPIAIFVGLLTIGLCIFVFKRWIDKQKGKRKILDGASNHSKALSDSKKHVEPDVPMFKYEILAAATANFDLANKLGEGGFGSVYKGKLPSGEEVAVKCLSKNSGQGTEEFKNEVAVISRLQHRNLVKLLGFCIEKDEKMLIYEYMPNKSLDVVIFDPTQKTLLGWKKCFQIIEGIGRGILYLHRDSRLRVIHRDLKPSNILLDKNLSPKIADFGMARIVGGDELEANTRRVVGTYGYMSPEYAMDGLFSEKSDVFSFGVLLLEIVTGKKNTGFYHHKESTSLIQHVWKLWKRDMTQELFDPTISDPQFEKEIVRCIQLGLLCVQEFAEDRPSIWSIISMLTSEITTIPAPKQPAFSERPPIAISNQKICSINDVSLTKLEAR